MHDAAPKFVTDVLAYLILPPGGPLLLVIAGLLVVRRRLAAGVVLAGAGTALLWLASMGVVGSSLVRALEPPPVARAALADAQAIVVLGGGLIEPSPEYGAPVVANEPLARLRYAARLARDTSLPVLVSAGSPYRGFPEAEAMASALRTDFSVEPRWIEKASPTTAANAALSYAVLAREGRTRIALVTTAWHMPRSERAFRAAGFRVVAAPTAYVPRHPLRVIDFLPSAHGLSLTRIALWELLGMAWYAARA